MRWPPEAVGLGTVIHEFRDREYPLLQVHLDSGGYVQVDARCVSHADNILAFKKPARIKERSL